MSSPGGIKFETTLKMIVQLHTAAVERGWDIMLSNESCFQSRMLSVNLYTVLYINMIM